VFVPSATLVGIEIATEALVTALNEVVTGTKDEPGFWTQIW
jgi:hypothetical protein